jgi:hypothetical protein
MNLTSAHMFGRWDRNSPLRTESKQKGLEHDLTLGQSPTSIEVAPIKKEKTPIGYFFGCARAD